MTTPELPDGPATIQSRLAVALACRTSAEYRGRVIERARRDPVWWIDYFAFTFDPRLDGDRAAQPFLLYDFQRDLAREMVARIEQHRDLLVEKSRDMGVTWVAIAVLVHQFLFRNGFQALLGSRKETYVDNGQLDSLLGKAAWLLEMLPGWMLPRGWDPKKHRRFMKITNPANGAVLIGESSNPNFARGGRYAAILLDEAAFWPDLEAVWRSTGSSAPCRILVSTPNGRNTFARIRFSGQIDVLTLHWSLHPDRDKAWYDAEAERLIDPSTVAQELDISYDRSVSGLVYPGWADVPKGSYPFVEGWPLFVAIDFGIADPTAMIWLQRDPRSGRVRLIDAYANRGKPADFYVPLVTGEIPSDSPYDYTPFERDRIAAHSLWGIPVVYGDPAGEARSQASGESVVDVWRRAGVSVVTRPDAQRFAVRWQRTQLLLKDLDVNLPDCAEVDMALAAARFPERRADTQSTAERSRPVHDWTSHFRSALEYAAVNLPRHNRAGRPRPSRRVMAYDRVG